MKKKIVATMLIASMLIGSTISTNAASLSEVGDTATQTTPSDMTVTADDLGGLIVSIPESMTLAYDNVNSKFSGADNVYAYGYINDSNARLKIVADNSATFKNKDMETATDLTGAVTFGTDNAETWSVAELQQGAENAKRAEVACNVTDLSNLRVGHYEGNINYTVSLEETPKETLPCATIEASLIKDASSGKASVNMSLKHDCKDGLVSDVQTVYLAFNENVTVSSNSGTVLSGNGTNTLAVGYQYHLNPQDNAGGTDLEITCDDLDSLELQGAEVTVHGTDTSH